MCILLLYYYHFVLTYMHTCTMSPGRCAKEGDVIKISDEHIKRRRVCPFSQNMLKKRLEGLYPAVRLYVCVLSSVTYNEFHFTQLHLFYDNDDDKCDAQRHTRPLPVAY